MPSAMVVPYAKRDGSGGELDISKLHPDRYSSELEQEIYCALKAADVDDSGSIGMKEVRQPPCPNRVSRRF